MRDYLTADILAGCAEVLYRKGVQVFTDNGTQIGEIEEELYGGPLDTVRANDLRYGCCVDVVLRPITEYRYNLMEAEGYFYAVVGEHFKWNSGYTIRFIPNWKQIVEDDLKTHKAEFVFSKAVVK